LGTRKGSRQELGQIKGNGRSRALAALPVEAAAPYNPVTPTPQFSAVSGVAFRAAGGDDERSSLVAFAVLGESLICLCPKDNLNIFVLFSSAG